jgi:hypothetical protein
MHDFAEDGVSESIEGPINRIIEAPFSGSPTWKKITGGASLSLDEQDKIPI